MKPFCVILGISAVIALANGGTLANGVYERGVGWRKFVPQREIMRRQSYCQSLSIGSEPQIIVEESTLGEEEAELRRNESPPRCLAPDSPSLNPYLLSPWRETRKHSLPTPQCTGITASQVRRLSERGGEGSGPSPREAAFLATLSQAPAPQRGGRRHSVVTISKVPPTLFGRGRRESIAALPMGATRILPPRRDSASGMAGPPSNSGSTHNLQLDIMDDIAEMKARKVRLKMWKTPSHERMCEVQPLEGNASTQRYTQNNQRRYSDFTTISTPSTSASASRRRASEFPIPSTSSSFSPGIVCSNTDLISILSSLTSSASEIDRSGKEPPREEKPTGLEQKRQRLKDFRSNSFDVSILHGTKLKLPDPEKGSAAPSSWFVNRHQPMREKQRDTDINLSSLSSKFDKSKVVKVVKETLNRSSSSSQEPAKHKVVWDGISGTKVDAQVIGSAIEEFLTSQKALDANCSVSGISEVKESGLPNKVSDKGWFGGATKQEEKAETCETSICSSLKDLFVKRDYQRQLEGAI